MAITAPRALMRYPWPRKRARDLWTAFYHLTRGRRFVGRRLGFDLLFDTDNVVDKYLLAFGTYEEAQQRQLFAATRAAARDGEARIFLDVGAHWGVYALVAHKTGLFDRILAVEADGRNLGQLHANLFLNGLSGAIEVVDAAASDRTGELAFTLAAGRSRVVSKVAEPGTAEAGPTRRVRSVRLDDLTDLKDGLLVAKIDVEGHERAVIQGMERLLRQNRAVLQVEVFDTAFPEISAVMAGLGYRCFAEIGHDRYFRNF